MRMEGHGRMNMFRALKAREIDCRVQMVRQNGVSLLLYKDARCDLSLIHI